MAKDACVAHGQVRRGDTYLFLRRRRGRYLGGQCDLPGGSELTHFENPDTNGRDLTFHTVTYRMHLRDDPSDVRLSDEEHDDFRWLDAAAALDLPLVWHVARTPAESGPT